ncbi:MAG: YggU family protein [Deltaproteobacteria bacterium]|nr:YggU family protein [Deltaproteobacteria bacterium]
MKLTVKITPNSKKSEIMGWEGALLKIKIQAPPLEGKANTELVRFLSKQWGISKSSIHILSGETSRIKTLEIPDTAREIINNIS